MKRIFIYVGVFLSLLFAYDTLLPPISTLMMARYATARPVTRTWVPISRISPNVVRAIIAAEDGKFCTHDGVDWVALRGVVHSAMDPKGRVTHGASTITMQTTKNLFLWHGSYWVGFSYMRKPFEVPLAVALDALWGKRRVMEAYLNIAEFGKGIFGIEAAARHYFGISAAQVSPTQAALLAATLPAPTRRNPANPDGYMQGYADDIMGRVNRGVRSGCTR